MAEAGVGEPEHGGQLVDGLLLHSLVTRPAVERVVVRVDEHRRHVAGRRDGVRRLEHLAGVARVEEREVVAHPLANSSHAAAKRSGPSAAACGLVRAEPRLPRADQRGGARNEVGELI